MIIIDCDETCSDRSACQVVLGKGIMCFSSVFVEKNRLKSLSEKYDLPTVGVVFTQEAHSAVGVR